MKLIEKQSPWNKQLIIEHIIYIVGEYFAIVRQNDDDDWPYFRAVADHWNRKVLSFTVS